MNIEEKKINPAIPLTEEERILFAKVDEHESDLIKLLQEMVKIDSVNVAEDVYAERNEIFEFVEKTMKKSGFKTQLVKAPFPGGRKNQFYYNLIAALEGKGPGKSLQFNGHLDTVAYNQENWNPDTPPLGAVVKDGRMYGRGSGDMKGGIAAMIMAMRILKDSKIDLKGKLQLWCTPDEETHGAYGAGYMVAHHPELVKTDATIISEGRSQAPLITPIMTAGEKGPHWLKFTFFGAAGHGSFPKKKSNALNKAVRFMFHAEKHLRIPRRRLPENTVSLFRSFLKRYSLTDLLKLLSKKNPPSNPYEKDRRTYRSMHETTYSFDKIRAGEKVNIVPDRCELEVDFRVQPGISAQQLFDAIADYCAWLGYKVELPEGFENKQKKKSGFENEPVDIEISIITLGEGFFVDKNSEFGRVLANSFEAVYETAPVYTLSSGFSDASNMYAGGMKDVFIVGPQGQNAHNANESVDIASLIETVKLYLLTAYRYLS
jgi:succinyl-diaminopimelate desuccinylase